MLPCCLCSSHAANRSAEGASPAAAKPTRSKPSSRTSARSSSRAASRSTSLAASGMADLYCHDFFGRTTGHGADFHQAVEWINDWVGALELEPRRQDQRPGALPGDSTHVGCSSTAQSAGHHGARARHRPVSYTHLTLPTSDLV